VELIELTPLLSTHNRFQSHWNESGTVKPVPSSKSVPPQLEPLTYRKINTYERSFISSGEPGFCLKQAKDSLQPAASVRETLLTSDKGVLPLDETASARQLKFSALRRLGTTQPRPVMAGLTESEARRGMKLTYHWDREFPRRRGAPRTPREQ